MPRFLLTLLAGLLCLPGLAQQPAAPAAERKPFAWKVQSSTSVTYLVGSIHLARQDLYPLDPKLEQAFASSQALVLELDPTNPAAEQVLLARAMYPKGDSVQAHIAAPVLADTDKRLRQLGLSLLPFSQFKAWFIGQTLAITQMQKLGFSPTYGIDLYFLQKARGANPKKVLELETADQQIDLLDQMTDKEQELFLVYTIRELDDTSKHINDILGAWMTADAAKLDQFLKQAAVEAPELAGVYKRLIDDRIVGMAQKVQGYLGTKETYFVVVGAAHLVGEKGVIKLLEKAGFKPEPL